MYVTHIMLILIMDLLSNSGVDNIVTVQASLTFAGHKP